MNFLSIFSKQALMRRVLISLVPIILLGVYLFGLRVLVLLAVVTVAGVVTEYIMLCYSNPGKPVKIPEAILVTCVLFTLTLPPTIPIWIAIVGIVFGVFFGKAVFGGFGRNIFNPALVGRCFIYISFPSYMTLSWMQPFQELPGGFLRYSGGVDAVTSSTPLILLGSSGEIPSYAQLILGSISGCIGETSVLLIVLAAIYLIYTKTASWKIMASTTISFLLLDAVLYAAGVGHPPLVALLSGGFLFGTVFMTTDPITAPKNDTARIIYGVLIGVLTVIIRNFSLFTEGIMFAILLANIFVPLIEMQVADFMARKKVAA